MYTSKGDINLWIESFLRERGCSKYELEIIGNTEKGDGYLGEVTFANVLTGVDGEEKNTYNIVIKSAKKSEALRKQAPITDVFKREMFMYTRVFPKFEAFQLEHGVETPFVKHPKCYSVHDEINREAILLQNLKPHGFVIHDRKTPQNLHHASCVFESYGKLHAISLAMKNQSPDIYQELTQELTDIWFKFFVQADMLSNIATSFQDGLRLLKGKNDEAYRKLEGLDEKMIGKAMCKEKDPSDGISVILHGDCWNNNMMFKYQGTSKTKPTDMVFLDFQISSVGSPIYDLSYYLYSIGDARLFKYFDLLLQTYHYSLTSSLEEMNVTCYNITMEDLKRHWKKYGVFGVLIAPFIIKIELSEGNEVMDLVECAEEGNLNKALDIKINNMGAFEDRVRAVISHYASVI